MHTAAVIRTTVAVAIVLGTAAAASAQKITVKAATPNNGAQGSVNLDILIDGSGFGADSQAQFHVSGTTNPGGIKVNRTTRLSNAQLRANIDIDDLALLSYYDVKVVSNGRTGKGTDLFQVVQKPQACSEPPVLLAPQVVDLPLPGTAQSCQPGLPGSLDCTFGVGGRLVTTAIQNGMGWRVAPQADGTLVVLASGTPPSGTATSGLFVVRYTAAGVLDATFANGGIRYLDYLSDRAATAGSLALQADGKIVVGASAFPRKGQASVAAVTRLMSNGAVDTTFGSGGLVTFSYESSNKSSVVQGVAVQADGKILVNGFNGVARLMPNGALDPTFDLDGRLVVPAEPGEGDLRLSSLTLQHVGGVSRILLMGASTACDGGGQMAVVRLHGNGALDTTFGPFGSGRVFLRLTSLAHSAHGAAIDALGRLVVTGWVTHLEGEAAEGRLAAVRLLADGQVDVSYGQAGALLVGIEGRKAYSEASPLIDDVGRLVIAGWTQNHVSPFDERFLVVRLLDSGQVDPAFGASGVAVTDFGAGPDYAASSALDAAGRIVLVGKAVLSAIGLSRYVP